MVDDAVQKGAKVLTGGKAPGGPGFFYPATVRVERLQRRQDLNEEIFGPVASLQTFKSEDEVITRANDTEYGLVAYLYTKDLSRGLRVSEKLDFGMIGLNRGIVSDPAAPFGGMKIGPRPRRRARRTDGIFRNAVRVGDVVKFLIRQARLLCWTSTSLSDRADVVGWPGQVGHDEFKECGNCNEHPHAAARRDRRRGKNHQVVQVSRRCGATGRQSVRDRDR